MRSTTLALIALGAGLALGMAVSATDSALLRTAADSLEPIGTLWVNALRMTVFPIVISAILLGIDGLPDSRSMGRIGGRGFGFFLLTLLAAATFAVVVGPFVMARLSMEPGSAAQLRKLSGARVQSVPMLMTASEWFIALIPPNPVKSAADGAMLQVIVFTIAFGLAVTTLPAPTRQQFMLSVRAVHDGSLTLVRWALRVAPVGVFALTVPLAVKLGLAAAGAATFYVVAACAFTAGFSALFYVAAWVGGGVNVAMFARACAPVQAVALSSRSSLASLPALMDSSVRVLELPASVRSFVLPLAVATFRPAGAIAIPMGVLFVARLYGVHLTAHQLWMLVLTTVATTFSVPGVPNGSLLVIAPILASLGLPAEAVGLLIGVDALPDTVRTVANVTGDMAAAVVIARWDPSDVKGSAAVIPLTPS